jgi:hypothetical protein
MQVSPSDLQRAGPIISAPGLTFRYPLVPVLIMRDQLGCFAELRVALVEKRRKTRQSVRR